MDLRSLGTAGLGMGSLGSAGLGGSPTGTVGLLGGNMAARERNQVDMQSFEEALRSAAAARSAPADVPYASTEPTAPELSRSAPRGVVIDRESELFQQCLELEIFIIKTLISSMRSTIQRSDLIEQSFAGEMYEDMLFDEYARQMAENANFGLAEMAYLELTGQRGMVVLR